MVESKQAREADSLYKYIHKPQRLLACGRIKVLPSNCTNCRVKIYDRLLNTGVLPLADEAPGLRMPKFEGV